MTRLLWLSIAAISFTSTSSNVNAFSLRRSLTTKDDAASSSSSSTNQRRQLSSLPLHSAHSHPNAKLMERDDKMRRYPRFQRQRHLQEPTTTATTTAEQQQQEEQQQEEEEAMDPFEDKGDIDQLYQGYGTHYVDLWVGCPQPQRQTVIVDTGSSVTAFPCSQCVDCGQGYHVDNVYNESQSSCFHPVTTCNACQLGGSCSTAAAAGGGGRQGNACQIQVAYQEGSSWLAYEAEDVVYSGGSHTEQQEDTTTATTTTKEEPFRFHFGCQTRLTGLFQTQLEGGIMGMDLDDPSYWKQMYQQGHIDEPMFALCYTRQPVVSRKGTQAGAMTMGGADPRLHTTPMVYAAQLNDSGNGWYVVNIKNMYLRSGSGGERVTPIDGPAAVDVVQVNAPEKILNGNGHVIVDSGTTDTFLYKSLAKPFQEAWSKITGGQTYSNAGIALTDEQLLALPTILIQLQAWSGSNSNKDDGTNNNTLDPANPNDIIVAFPPTHYMEFSEKAQKYMSRLYFDEPEGGVLGANFMMGHDILFDNKNQRIGFAESECDYGHVVAPEDASQ